MLGPFRKRRLKKLAKEAEAYLRREYSAPEESPEGSWKDGTRYSKVMLDPAIIEEADRRVEEGRVSYSIRRENDEAQGDRYDGESISRTMRSFSGISSPTRTLRALEEHTDRSFVEKMLEHINRKRLRDADVYKAAQVDRRLFSKIVSDREYRPAKDTCVALCLALHLSLQQTNDLLSRAGYTFSHSSKRDVILEFFFREGVYDLNDANEILFDLGQKLLGRT